MFIIKTVNNTTVKTSLPFKSAFPGFSLVELVLTIAILGVLTSVVVLRYGAQGTRVGELKLEADVRQLNQMVSLYKADGGSLANLTQTTSVIEKLKNYRPESTIKSHTGPVSGRLMDARIVPVMGSGSAGKPRAVWDATKQQFIIVIDGRQGAMSFAMDANRSNDGGQAENRPGGQVVKFDSSSGPTWIWGAPTQQATTATYNPTDLSGGGLNNPFDPSVSSGTGSGAGTGGGSGSGGGSGGSGGGSGPNPPAGPAKLPTPLVTQSGGTYSFSSFPSSVSISSNGAPVGDSVLMYRKGTGAWQVSGGGSVSIAPGDVVEAQNLPAVGVTTVTSSDVNRNEYFRLVAGFTGGFQPSISNVTGGSNLTFNTDTSTPGKIVFTHGDPQTDLGNGEIINTGEASVIELTTKSFSAAQPNQWFSLADVALRNGEIFNNSGADKLRLQLNLNISNPAYVGTANIELETINTPTVFVAGTNTPDRLKSADIVKFSDPKTNVVVVIDGINYRLEVSWQSSDPTTGVVSGNDFLVFEGGTASGSLRARFVSDR